VARALVVKPKLILADEPTGNLDSEHGDEVMKLLKGLNAEGTTILMVTHSAPNAQFSKRVVNLLDGKVVSDRANGQA
jgi:putative ABC transport system ATP-binding protein